MLGAVGHTGRPGGAGSSSARGQDPAPPSTGRPSGGVIAGTGAAETGPAGSGVAGGLLVTIVAAWSGRIRGSDVEMGRDGATDAPHWPQNASPAPTALPQPSQSRATDEPSPYASLGRRRMA